MSDDRPAITQQYSFAVGKDGETDGIEPTEESVETSLETFGADVDHRERDSRIDQPEATTFGVDDRVTVTRGDGGEQHALFADTEDDQQTLTGECAASQCLFETDEQDDDRDDITSEEYTATTNEASPRAVVTDGGKRTTGDDEERTCEACGSFNNVFNGFVHDVTDESWTDYDALCRECFIAVAAAGHDAESEKPNESGEHRESEDVIVAVPRKELAGVADALDAERETIKRHAGEGPRTEKLARYVEECRTGLEILDDTDENGTISRVVATAAADELQEAARTETGEYAEELQRLSRVLRCALDGQSSSDESDHDDTESDGEPMTDGGRDDTFDPDAETVTEAWEGTYIYASWGYNQTNVELAQIVEVSESGKTVLAQRIGAERVGHGRISEQLRPTAEQFGDEFRLHVRNSGSDPAFRGTYPLSGGDMDDSPTRRGWFSPFDNKTENSIRQTRTGFGH